ncbi:hypothetical protein [Sphingobium sp. SCG-1]|uniref:hypothetical protein n=1 Tax=Sphingobium sp. SCG-1 TaxID=2072936 RepID=UPI001CB9A313|nr:hypothetical protein [Sphingobium sp. SCG-1]
MIPRRDLSRIASGLLKPRGRRVPEAVIECDYCLAWFLTGLAQHPLREFLAFKGGTACADAGSRITASPRISVRRGGPEGAA